MKKITMQDIADSLNVSRVSVWKVLNNKDGVSSNLRNKVIAEAKRLGYWKTDSQKLPILSNNNSQKNISVVISRPESSAFWINIIHAVARELNEFNISLIYTYLPPKYEKGYLLPETLTEHDNIDGILVMNVYDKKLLSMINKLKLPKIFLDIVSDFSLTEVTGDLILLKGKSAIKKITNHLIETGRSKIGFIGDVNYALTNKYRHQGYLNAMQENKLKINKDYCLTKEIGIYSYYEEISSFLNNLEELPDAFVCASDFVANFLMRYFVEHAIKVPEEIAISGYDGNNEYSMISGKLTTVEVKTDYLGKRLADNLLYRIKNPNSPTTVTNIYSEISWNESTKI